MVNKFNKNVLSGILLKSFIQCSFTSGARADPHMGYSKLGAKKISIDTSFFTPEKMASRLRKLIEKHKEVTAASKQTGTGASRDLKPVDFVLAGLLSAVASKQQGKAHEVNLFYTMKL